MSSILDKFYQDLEKNRREIQSLAIGISRDGSSICEELDEKPYNHAVAFNYIASQFDLEVVETMNPMEAGKNLANQDVLALQIRNDICIGYLPTYLELVQYEKLELELSEYENLDYQFEGCTQTEGFVSKEDFLHYARSITVNYTLNQNEIDSPKRV